jgi:hypothetical protein
MPEIEIEIDELVTELVQRRLQELEQPSFVDRPFHVDARKKNGR